MPTHGRHHRTWPTLPRTTDGRNGKATTIEGRRAALAKELVRQHTGGFAREVHAKDIKGEVLTGPRQFDEIMEKLEIINAHDAKMSQDDSDVCAKDWRGYKAGKGAGKKGPNGSGTWHRGKRS